MEPSAVGGAQLSLAYACPGMRQVRSRVQSGVISIIEKTGKEGKYTQRGLDVCL